VRLDQLRAVFLSHLYWDHTFCVAELLTRLAFWNFTLSSICGPCGTRNYVDSALDFARTTLGSRSRERLKTPVIPEKAIALILLDSSYPAEHNQAA
jgi:ribonuclease BN (tRNA processing enzyme)